MPEDLSDEATNIIKVAEKDTCDPICQELAALQDRFSSLQESCAESVELCEEAKTHMQRYHDREAVFTSLFTKLKEGLEGLKSKPKKPLGNIQEVLDEHVVGVQGMVALALGGRKLFGILWEFCLLSAD